MKLKELVEAQDELEFIRMMTRGLVHLDLNVQPAHVKTARNPAARPKACFNNAYLYLLGKSRSDEDRYVLGYTFVRGIPIEHAWVKVGGQQYDVTLEAERQDGYAEVVQVPLDVIVAFVAKHEFAPSLYDLNRFMGGRG